MGAVKRLPVWGWIVGIVGLGAVVSGAFAEGYLQDVLLQFGTVAVLLVPLLLVERSISARLRQRIDDYEAVRRAEVVLDMDDMWRDFGMKLGGKHQDGYPIDEVEAWMREAGWNSHRVVDDHTVWKSGDRLLALPTPIDGVLPAPHVRVVMRRLGWNDADWDAHTSDDPR